MSKQKFTPGPWLASPYGIIVAGAPRQIVVARVESYTVNARLEYMPLPAEANANLIAASPSLLAACQDAYTALDAYVDQCQCDGRRMCAADEELHRKLHAAITKAVLGEAT